MTLDQLELIRKLIRGKDDSTAFVAAKAVLVEGANQAEIARQLGVTISTVNSGVMRYKKVDEEIKKLYLQS